MENMTDELGQYHKELLNSVESTAAIEGLLPHEVFVQTCSSLLYEVDAIDNLQLAYFRGRGFRNRSLAVDGYDLDDPDDSISLVVCDFSQNPESTTLPTSEAHRMLDSLRYYLIDATSGRFIEDREESEPAYALAQDLQNRGRSVSRYRLFLLTNRRLSGKELRPSEESVQGVPVESQIWDITRLRQAELSLAAPEKLNVVFTDWYPEGLPALQTPDAKSGDFSITMTVLPGEILAELYKRFGSRLLEANVRSYLSARGKVNKGIQRTLSVEPEKFIAFNNGITATATSIIFRAGNIIRANDLQIVNGGQTTAALYYSRKNDAHIRENISKALVPAKIVSVNADEVEELVPSIARYSNSQNKISEADFFSNSPFHRRVEELSRRILVPTALGKSYDTHWYYERTRGQYNNERLKGTKAEEKKFSALFPRAQLLTKTDAAKYSVSWEQKPHEVSKGAQKNFLAFAKEAGAQWESDPEAINEEYFRRLVGKALLFRALERGVSHADWYEHAYRANIVTYGIAKLSFDLRTQKKDLNWNLLWKHQAVPDLLLEVMLEYAFDMSGILNAESRPTLNVTEWAKKTECWDVAKHAPRHIDERLDAYLLSTSESKRVAREAKQVQSIDDDIGLVAELLKRNMSEWDDLVGFATSRGALSPIEANIVRIIKEGRMPSPKQATKINQFIIRMEDMGFKAPVK